MRFVVMGLVSLLASSVSASAQLDDKVADRLWESAKVLEDLTNAPDGGIPRELLKRADCVAVIPSVKKAALGIGGHYGRGAVSCRKDEGKGPWGPPAMIAIGGASFGLQVGGQARDVVMLFMTPESMGHLLRDKVTLGADISVAAGPKGRAASAQTSATLRAEILTYERSRGVFAGVSLNGAVLKPDKEANKSLYNRTVNPSELLTVGDVATPEAARKFLDALAKVS